ncbi:zinc-binding alcohol dehydrogenase family protein [Leuconostoc gelidum subsp. gasicomitatum]|uniref:zinc-binding alcohol dehydrogenase family protein n=1 Tax=Leuconostoc gasicomitatum TaxID=115778 RepID=UPI001CC4F7D5|nr:zinc-binding alcohol dehydrogenase family protein [Leuconostoc gasicomitatum]MBZ5984177.1 zinc-binding alcohol dehydrogenase family protein [Leuconostoc gasicomitatum]
MISIKQVDYNGIDSLEYVIEPIPKVTTNGVLVKMSVLPVVPTDLKKENNPHATSEQFGKLPRTIGVSGVGTIVAVGGNRDQKLINKRAFLLNPAGAFSEYVLNENNNWLFVLPDCVSDNEAATLTATSLVLKKEIEKSASSNIFITGANSVIGIYLLQQLNTVNKKIYPIVTPSSKTYLNDFLPDIQVYTVSDIKEKFDSAIVADIAGNTEILKVLSDKIVDLSIVSIAIMTQNEFSNFKFVHESFDHSTYKHLIEALANHSLKAPIGEIFDDHDVKTAQHFLEDNHSRGRILVKF